MTDYDYSHQRVALTGDSGENGAATLGGYSLEVQKQPNWPGTTADPNSQRLNTDRMLDVASVIDGYVQALQNSGALQVEGDTAVSFGPDRWQAAVYLGEANKQVARLVSQYTNKLIQNLTDASTAIRKAAGGYHGAESANQHSAGNQQASLDGGGHTSSTAY